VGLLPGRVGGLAETTGPADLGATRADPYRAPPRPLEAGVHGRDLLLCPWRVAGAAVQTQPDSYNDHTLIGVLKRLRRFLRGSTATLIWDNLPSQHSRVMRDWLAGQRHWLQLEYLPSYAHDLDPVEGLWANLKGMELANLTRDTVAEVLMAAQQGVARVRREPALLFSFLRHCGLDL
jgi:transposase